MPSKINAPAQIGFESRLIEVECDLANGLPSLVIVGLPDKAVEEAKERVRGAIKNSNLTLPPKRITINLAPADLPKDGSGYDLALAVAILTASNQLEGNKVKAMFAGELSLDGDLRPIKGALACSQLAGDLGVRQLFLPAANAREAALMQGVEIYPVDNLRQLYRHLTGEEPLLPYKDRLKLKYDVKCATDLRMVYGQEQAKRGLEIAAAGGHNLLFSGPPGTGKTLLARALMGLLPPLELSEIMEITKLYSLTGLNGHNIVTDRPFRSPHHTASDIALIGGGTWPKPGEISLSHLGVLFLDELPEFPRSVIEALRQPLEDGQVTVARANGSVTFPARFMLVATQNPCPCGFAGDSLRECSCSLAQINRYQRKVSGPLIDRIDMVIEVNRVKQASLVQAEGGESTAVVARRVMKARQAQRLRLDSTNLTNAMMSNEDIKRFCRLDTACQSLAERAIPSLRLSARAYMRVLKVARTIADLAGIDQLEEAHLAEALQYRSRV